MAQFLLMRHGEADFELVHQRKMIGGSRDWAPLTDTGMTQIRAAAAELHDRRLELVLCSPMTRAVHSAAIPSNELKLPLTLEFDLHEWSTN